MAAPPPAARPAPAPRRSGALSKAWSRQRAARQPGSTACPSPHFDNAAEKRVPPSRCPAAMAPFHATPLADFVPWSPFRQRAHVPRAPFPPPAETAIPADLAHRVFWRGDSPSDCEVCVVGLITPGVRPRRSRIRVGRAHPHRARTQVGAPCRPAPRRAMDPRSIRRHRAARHCVPSAARRPRSQNLRKTRASCLNHISPRADLSYP